jgi:hypothetical protein
MASTDGTLTGRLAIENRVRETTVSLQLESGGYSVRATLDKTAVRHAGIDTTDPGKVESYYLYDDELLVFDLGGNFNVEE